MAGARPLSNQTSAQRPAPVSPLGRAMEESQEDSENDAFQADAQNLEIRAYTSSPDNGHSHKKTIMKMRSKQPTQDLEIGRPGAPDLDQELDPVSAY